jgi:IS30 family transposase
MPATPIDLRPAVVLQRCRIGDWEGDLIVGRNSRSAVATLVDRTSRYLRLVHLPLAHTAEAVRDALLAALGQLPEVARLTLTWDQGSEMAKHHQVATVLRHGVYFAHPASPWQRGTNENTNGLVRQYLPKGSDLSVHTAEDLKAIEDKLNNRPRKVLDWRTPAEVFASVLSS